MKILKSTNELVIPNNIAIEVKGRAVRVKGPRGTLQREWALEVAPQKGLSFTQPHAGPAQVRIADKQLARDY
jgi:ribosomal protein L6P/L9E